MSRLVGGLIGTFLVWGVLLPPAVAAPFQAGVAECDITPTRPTPLWGYAARHRELSQGVRDPLKAKALVLAVGNQRLAIVGTDLGRGPRADMLQRIRAAVQQGSGITWVLISGSHTHCGPVLELRNERGEGQGTFDDAIAYTGELEQKLIGVIQEAAGRLQDARIGWGSAQTTLNRNRHSKLEAKPVDAELSVLRLDDLAGHPIAVVVNFAAHATILGPAERRFSADYPGVMMAEVQQATGAPCLFLPGAAGDLSPNTGDQTRTIESFGHALAQEALAINTNLQTRVPEKPSLQGAEETFRFSTRLDFGNPLVVGGFGAAFFPELALAYVHEEIDQNTIRPQLTTVLVNGQLALVGVSGELFADHANRLKARSRATKTLVVGYCNGHQMYFPTIEGAAEGGYGGEATMNFAALGAGEQIMDHALIQIYTMLGRYRSKIPGL